MTTTMNDVKDSDPVKLDIPNMRSKSEQLRVLAFGYMFQMLVDTISLPVLLAVDSNRFKVTIDTPQTGKCQLCIYIPKNIDENKPRGVVMHLHGGGWTISRPETEAPLCRYIVDNVGVVVVAPDYCRAPQHPYPFALHQCHYILQWIASGGLNLEIQKTKWRSTVSIDSTRIALSGGSAGSNLACALTALTISHPLSYNARVVAQSLLYPALNLAVPYDEKIARVNPAQNLPQWACRFFLRAYLPPPRSAEDPLVSPALTPEDVLCRFPPTAILTAAYDYLHFEAQDFARKLEEQGVSVVEKRFEDVGHGFDGIPTRDQKQRMLNQKARDEAWGMIADLFKKVFV